MGRSRLGLILAASLCVVHGASAVVPDTSSARRQTHSEVTAPMAEFRPVARRVLTQSDRSLVLYRTEQQGGSRYFIYIATDGEAVDLVQPGTWIVRRRIEDGAFEQVKIFLQRDEGSFVRVTPDGSRSRLELYLAGARLYSAVPVPMSFERLLTASFGEIEAATASRIDWNLVQADVGHGGYRAIERFVDLTRRALPTLAPDITSTDFATWVADRLHRERAAGEPIATEWLAERHPDHRGTSWTASREADGNPFLALDWTRNLAREMAALDAGGDAAAIDPEAMDVREVPVGIYHEDLGYAVAQVRQVLYWLALTEPGTAYLGSVSERVGDQTLVREHTSVVVLFPWFDAEGRLQVAALERGSETGIPSLLRRFGTEYIHLVRVVVASD